MKHVLALSFITLCADSIFGQEAETNMKLDVNSAVKQKNLFIRDNVTFATYNIQLSALENEIAELEARECKAILKRDTLVLKEIWIRDFTLDEPLDGLVNGKNSLPYYTSFHRIVEKFSTMDNLAFTSGYELVQQLSVTGKLADIKQSFFHTWTRKNGVWKLSTKTKD